MPVGDGREPEGEQNESPTGLLQFGIAKRPDLDASLFFIFWGSVSCTAAPSWNEEMLWKGS
jgi:hypothetical protein